MRQRFIKLGFLAAALCTAQPVLADFGCSGKVTSTYITDSGATLIAGDWRGSYTQVCNISVAWNSIPPEVCAAWIAKIDAAVTLQRTVRVYYRGTGDCAALPTYGSSIPPYYVMLY